MVSACARRQQVAYASARGLSQRRACALIRTARSGLRYESKKTASDAAAVTKMMELARQYLRYGYRRIRIFLGREGYKMSYDRAYRLWRIAKLQVPKKRPRRRVAAARPKAIVATGPNQVWAYDFVFDACANGQQLKCLTVIDEHTRAEHVNTFETEVTRILCSERAGERRAGQGREARGGRTLGFA